MRFLCFWGTFKFDCCSDAIYFLLFVGGKFPSYEGGNKGITRGREGQEVGLKRAREIFELRPVRPGGHGASSDGDIKTFWSFDGFIWRSAVGIVTLEAGSGGETDALWRLVGFLWSWRGFESGLSGLGSYALGTGLFWCWRGFAVDSLGLGA